MADTLMLPLNGLSTKNGNTPYDLMGRIKQIEKHQGLFRNVTEKSIRQDTQQSEADDDDELMRDEGNSEEDIPEARRDIIRKGKEGMMKQLDRASNEILMALDFVSFVLSKHSATGQTSMSPALKEAVPSGTADSRITKYRVQSAQEQSRMESVSRGWKMDSFRSTGEKLGDAAHRLQSHASRESAFWAQIAAIKVKGWAVSRLPRDARAIGVHFGFADSSSKFRNRGLGIVQLNSVGKLQLDRLKDSLDRKFLHIVIARNGLKVAQCPLFGHGTSDSGSPESDEDLIQARNDLFEEELFFEAGREARTLVAEGVTMSATAIKFSVREEYEVHLEMTNDTISTVKTSGTEYHIAEIVALSLRFLLSRCHAQNLARRSEPPPPLTLKPVHQSEYSILKPIITILRHRATIASLQAFLISVGRPLLKAGLNVRMALQDPSATDVSNSSAILQPIFEKLLAPAVSVLKICLPTGQELKITIRTQIGPPTYGTDFSASSVMYEFGNLTAPRLRDLPDVQKFLCQAIQMDLTSFISSALGAELTDQGEAQKSPSTVSVKVMDAHNGEIAVRRSDQPDMLMVMHVWQDRLGLRCMHKGRSGVTDAPKTSCIWEADKYTMNPEMGQNWPGPRHLSEIIKHLLGPEISPTRIK